MKRIYLDQNQWIYLLKNYSNNDKASIDLINLIKEKIKIGEIILPLSLCHINETMKISDKTRRENLWGFMVEMSANNTMCPFLRFLTEIEAQNLFYRRLGTPEIEIKKYIFKKGASGLFGKEPSLVGAEKMQPEIAKELLSRVDSQETLKNLFSTPESVAHAQETARFYEQETKKIDEIRYKERSLKDTDLNNRVVMARYFVKEVVPILADFGVKLRLNKDFLIKEGATRKDAEKLFQELPATYCYFCLTDRRDRMKERKISPHDMNDIFAFAVAIPYCDIVFGEKMFIQLAKQAKLDKIYNTKLITTFEEFKELIL